MHEIAKRFKERSIDFINRLAITNRVSIAVSGKAGQRHNRKKGGARLKAPNERRRAGNGRWAPAEG